VLPAVSAAAARRERRIVLNPPRRCPDAERHVAEGRALADVDSANAPNTTLVSAFLPPLFCASPSTFILRLIG
jgi:hypothetical protein